jgi:phospholipase C
MPRILYMKLAPIILAALLVSLAYSRGMPVAAQAQATTTPIQHLVVIFQENVSFDHYFATYPNTAGMPGDPLFTAAAGTPTVNGLGGDLLTNNPNAANPFRFDRDQALTCDQDHAYTDEQKAFNGGKMDQFVQSVEGKPSNPLQYCPADANGNLYAVMGYYDAGTVTALWNYAQNFAMNDSSYSTVFGPSTPGAINLVAADTSGVLCGAPGPNYGPDIPLCGDKNAPPASSVATPAPSGATTGTTTNDSDPYWDICSKQDASALSASSLRNIGDMMNDAGLTWGFFEGGFRLTPDGMCSAKHNPEAALRAMGIDPATETTTLTADYIPHHEPFQYYASTANPMHLPPSSTSSIGRTDQANHQYDMDDFWTAANAGNMPAVSFLKAPAYQDGHAAYSDPLDEQVFLTNTINSLMLLPSWPNTAVLVLYDDSDGWYDHVFSPQGSRSNTPMDFMCGDTNTMNIPARCGFGPRQPFLVISPLAKKNYVSHTVTDQASVAKFIEDNWLGGARLGSTSFDNSAGSILDMFDFTQAGANPRTLNLDPDTGVPTGP